MRNKAPLLAILVVTGMVVAGAPAQSRQNASAPTVLSALAVPSPPAITVAQIAEDSERGSFVGTWRRTDVPEDCAANLCITKGKNPGELYVRMRAHNGGNEGFIEGKAIMQAPGQYTALMPFDDGKDSDNILGTLVFTMGQRGIDVSFKGDPSILKLGVGVTATGVYVKGKPNYVAAVDPLHCFRTAENFQTAIKLVGDKNALNMRDMFNNAIVVTDLPGQYRGYVQGTGMELQVKTDTKAHVYIFGRNVFANDDKKEMVFYTNDKSAVDRLTSIFEFIGDEREVFVVYKNIAAGSR